MTESKVETQFDKGARILSAVIAEVDISADLKATTQSVISMLAELLPRLLAQSATAPDTATPQADADVDDDAGAYHSLLATVTAPFENAGRARPPRGKSAARRGREPRPRIPDAATPVQKPLAVPAGVPEADVRLIWNTYEMVLGLQRSHAEQLSAALVAALNTRTDPARMVELLISASSGSARLWRAALDDLAKA
jgi:hypothetical protein